uniref:Uncharacterized protein n=1 Tax=Myotis myotis TaxID=51298 RepID=A0A7J7VZ90_MYOMY|nr:hypothetical protein mMyoMyo1_012302 [Myotis myotis]
MSPSRHTRAHTHWSPLVSPPPGPALCPLPQAHLCVPSPRPSSVSPPSSLAWFVHGPHSRWQLFSGRPGSGNPWGSPPRPTPDPGPEGGWTPSARASGCGPVCRCSPNCRPAILPHSLPVCPALGSRYI